MERRAITLLLNKVTQPTHSLYAVSYVWINNFIKTISPWCYFLDILVTGITHDKCTTITLPPSMGLSWLSSTLVLTISFLGSLYIASRLRVIFRFSRMACHSFRIAINNFPKLASSCHSFYTETCFRPGVYYNRCDKPHTVSYVHIVMPLQSMKNFKWHIHLNQYRKETTNR